MQEFFFTVLAIWLVWKLFSSFSGSSAGPRYQQNTHHHYYQEQQQQQQPPPNREGEVRIDKKVSPESKIPPTEGEYVDYEDIK